ncbi:MAG: LamG domain-containing protein, partial [Gemmataceae bacterium]|nr:LamG domain-containing protein [Gemmataceae bacterium]
MPWRAFNIIVLPKIGCMVPNGPVPQNFMEKQARFRKMPPWPVADNILVILNMKKILLLISLLAFLPLLIRYQRDLGETDDNSKGQAAPMAAWVLEAARIEKDAIPSTVGNWPLTLHAPPQAIKAPFEALFFGGGLTGGSVLSQKNKPTPTPKEALTLLAWVRLDAGARKGGIIGRVEDNRYGAGGTYLGYDETHLVFGLTPGGPGIGEGRLQTIRSAKPIDKGIWSLVVATYDGKEMRLFVNGELVAESTDARGPINWYRTDSWSIGRFSDENEKVPMIGAIREVEIYDKALSKESIRARFALQSARAKTVLGDSP